MVRLWLFGRIKREFGGIKEVCSPFGGTAGTVDNHVDGAIVVDGEGRFARVYTPVVTLAAVALAVACTLLVSL